MDFKLDEKVEYNEYNQPWVKESEDKFDMDPLSPLQRAISSKISEVRKYNWFRLYGAETPNLIAVKPNEEFKNMSMNKVKENTHSLKIENQLLNLFIIIFTLLATFQFALVLIVRFDLDLLEWDYHVLFHYSYLILLLIGKCLTYTFMASFFLRVYIGIKLFKDSVKTNVLMKLIKMQFVGFLASSLVAIGILSADMVLKFLLTELEVINQDETLINTKVLSMVNWITKMDWVFYSTVIAGLVLMGFRRLVKYLA
ncbi:uncharacterized protein CYBJADRAFT_191752 [Cyberlindnera jadinii NRRL Y-1542]|uniref:Uncharacterized protein n=1 Tax=Cyberlindnera jadinii (strain ATCC 18201 / CBS 1600 / BCRC 20928 / JCM 3617 / NBRC 0987 / NRRL Y-1542) TaxID=983966 RepID=A0A1E4RWE1_CYBJN|nr:hypothetical protein CYBJADRAFT_191752 [Cyberlindnera jadinii NRRL Y-1542]ODV71597.1 hypothetical protein CYBJADRAFT_191752 [Cyberlindnera jadinii NRRL Y-1542]